MTLTCYRDAPSTFINASHLTTTVALLFHNKYIFISYLFWQQCLIHGLNAMIKRISSGYKMQSYTVSCTCIFMCICLFSVDGIHVYRCTTHPVSLVGSELRVTLCVCAIVCTSVCLHFYQGTGYKGLFGESQSRQAGESHAGCSLGSVLMEFNLDLSSPHSSQCSIIMGLLI